MLAIFKEKEILKAVTTLLGTFYLLDLDYPQGWLVSLSILQKLVLGDKKVHPDAKGDIVKAFNDLEKYSTGEWTVIGHYMYFVILCIFYKSYLIKIFKSI